MPLIPGEILKERYRIVMLLGQGGFGAVYRAWDLSVNGPVALKENLETSASSQRQFSREARLLHKLRHPNLPQVFDHFVIRDQGQYLVMDYIDGEDLNTKLKTAGGSLPFNQVVDWIGQVCEALHYLHEQTPPIIHRDVKPANIRITPAGMALLVDFGIAKIYDPTGRTTIGARAVTQGYSPPEQYGAGRTDEYSDVYALGATAYHLFTGIMPPPAVDVFLKSSPPPKPAHTLNPMVPPEVSTAVAKAMRMEQVERGGALEFKEALLRHSKRAEATLVAVHQGSHLAGALEIVGMPEKDISEGAAQIWRAGSGEPKHVIKGHEKSVESVAWSPDGKTLASASVDKTVRLWQVTDGQMLKELTGHTRSVSTVVFSPTNKLLASGSSDRTVRVWDIKEGAIKQEIPDFNGLVTGLAFSPDGEILVTVSGNHTVQFWRIEEKSPFLTLKERTQGLTGVVFSPDGRLLAGESGREKTIRLWEVATGELVYVFEGHMADITSVAFSPDNTTLASGSWDNTIKIWQIEAERLINTVKGHNSGVLALDFTPDGEVLASASADKTIRLWQVSDWSLLKKFKRGTNWFNAAAFSPDGKQLASGSRDGTISIWYALN